MGCTSVDSIAGAIKSTGTGNVTVNGYGAVGMQYNDGVAITTGGIISAANGNLIVNGYGGNATQNGNYGVIVDGSSGNIAYIESTGTGNVTVTGIGGNGEQANDGVYVGAYSEIKVGNGSLGVTGTGGAGSAASSYNSDYGVIVTGTGSIISSSGTTSPGNVTISGTGANANNSDYGVYITAGGAITTVDAPLGITGNGGTGSTSGYGIYFQNNGTSYSTGSGNITFTGIGGGSSTGIYSTAASGNNQIGGASDTGNITFDTDRLSLASMPVRTTGTVTFAPYTITTPIGFSGGTGGTLNVTQAIMDNVNAPTVIVGRSDSTGNLTTGAFIWESTLNNLYLEGGSDTIGGNITKASGTNNAALYVDAGTNITVASNANVSSSSTFGQLAVTLDADTAAGGGSVYMASGSDIATNGGNIILGGGATPFTGYAYGDNATGGDNDQNGTSVYANGVFLNSATLNAAGGNITVNAHGWSSGAVLGDGANIYSSTLETTGNGTITINGKASDATAGGEDGVSINGAGYSTRSQIVTQAGNITITGDPDNGGHYGVGVLLGQGNVQSTSGSIILNGGLSDTTGYDGVGLGGTVTTTSGPIQVTGEGIQGVYLVTTISSATGNITINGESTTAGTGGGGVYGNFGGSINSTGTGASAAKITITGTGASGSGDDVGVLLGSGAINSVDGNISITGTGAGTGSNDFGIQLGGNRFVTTTGNATITLTGTGAGAAGIQSDESLDTSSVNTITSASGNVSLASLSSAMNLTDISITKNAGANSNLLLQSFENIALGTGAAISSTTGKFNVTLDADSGANGSGAISMASGTSIASNGGNIVLGGGAAPLTTDAYGNADMGGTDQNGKTIDSNGVFLNSATLDAGGGNITVNAHGYSNGTYASIYGIGTGINIYTSTLETTGNGTITLNGTAAINGAHDSGVSIDGAGYLTPGVVQTQAGAITINGDADNRGGYGSGVTISTANVLSDSGAIIINGGLSGTDENTGVTIYGHVITTSGPITVTGHGYDGIFLQPLISSATGNITITGVSTSTSSEGDGIYWNYGGIISSTGTGASAATITLTGTGAGTGDYGSDGRGNDGLLFGVGTLSSVDGNIIITGTGGGTGANNFGVQLAGDTTIASTGNATITMTGTGAGATGIRSDENLSTSSVNSVTSTGSNVKFVTDSLSLADLSVQTGANFTLVPLTASTSIGIAGGSGGLGITAAALNDITAGSITIGATSDTGLLTANAYSWSAPVTLLGGSGGIAINGMQTMGNNSFLAQTLSTGDITLGSSGGVTSTASGTAFVLASGHNFTDNNSSASALSVTGGGRWLVYSTKPSQDDDGALAGDFNLYSCVYNGSCPTLLSGNGLLYSYTPVLTATPSVTITYGDAAPNLTGYHYTLSGYVGSSDEANITIAGSLNGTTNYVQNDNAGSYYIDHTGGTLTNTLGYSIAYANSTTALTVSPKTLTATLTGTVQKAYDGTTIATLANSNYGLSNIINGDAVTLNDPTAGSFDTRLSAPARQ